MKITCRLDAERSRISSIASVCCVSSDSELMDLDDGLRARYSAINSVELPVSCIAVSVSVLQPSSKLKSYIKY